VTDRVRRWLERIDALGMRERALVFVAALGVLYIAWVQLLFEPLAAERDRVAADIERTRGQIQRVHQEIAAAVGRRGEDPDASARARLTALRGELTALDRSLRQVIKRVVPPEQMASLLEVMLTREPGLKLIKLEGLGAEPVIQAAHEARAPKDGAASAEAGFTLFRHGLHLEFEGQYLATLRYLKALEELPWQFLWDGVTLEVEHHPEARVSITVHSLSLEKAWIGV
jgi:MSHA biogenesis protein MshJ